jgi:ferritin-like metal-binding protein YciE
MALFRHEFNNLNDLFIEQLQDLYDAEKRLLKALPKMADAASTAELRQAFAEHHQQTNQHVQRLEQIFQRLGKTPESETSSAMKGLVSDGEGMVNAKGDDAVRDAALIAAAQRVEHYEIAGYGTARTFARQLGMSDVAQTLQQTLDEEGNTDKRLTQIAESQVNIQAQH